MARAKSGRHRPTPAIPAEALARLEMASVQHQHGRLDQAEAGYRGFLGRYPNHAGALHGLGLVLQQRGDLDGAVRALRKAVRRAPDDARCLGNLGNLLREQGHVEDAIASYRAALRIDPGALNVRFNLATALHAAGELPAAIEAFEQLARQCPGDAGVLAELGQARLEHGEPDAAVEALGEAITHVPGSAEALALGVRLCHAGHGDAVLERYRAAVGEAPGEAMAWHALATVLRALGDLDEAEGCAREALALAPKDPEIAFNLANVLHDAEKLGQAIRIYREVLENSPDRADVLCQLATALLVREGVAEAMPLLERALELEPGSAAAHSGLGSAWTIAGDPGRAAQHVARALELDPGHPEAWMALSRSRRFGAGDDALVRQGERLVEDPGASEALRINLHFALGKMHDDRAEHERAFGHFVAGNRLVRARNHYDRVEIEDRVAHSIETFTPELFERLASFGDRSELPVLVFGMPRSGTSLVEQILASHPLVHGAGELTALPELAMRLPNAPGLSGAYPACVATLTADVARQASSHYLESLRALDPDAVRITDKLPGNYMHLGLAAILFPHARLVHCRRDPMDVGLSNFVQLFAEGHRYAYSLGDLGHAWRQYERLMAHWRAVLPRTMHEIDYEWLVDNQEQASRSLIEYLGLDWDDRCLEFFAHRRPVMTASSWQVRQPMYRTAVARWRRYEPWLGELREALEGT